MVDELVKIRRNLTIMIYVFDKVTLHKFEITFTHKTCFGHELIDRVLGLSTT